MINETPWRHKTISYPFIGFTKIWELPVEHTQDPAVVGAWAIQAPWMHLAWDWHMACVFHLRLVPGTQEAKIYEGSPPDSTHEFMVYAVSPDHEPQRCESVEFRHLLSPASIVQQFVAKNDADALERVTKGIELVAECQLSVDSDFRGCWKKLLVGE